ncbi:MAP kinase kinase-like protein [Strigomonas culicis]|uniref:mitogen-activated protein kinase kinase n=1 Tax=Strigomonas culicis TaxID=28005 RepID=S9UK71_9TRYP|nr:MAP kinase kinase-like protein [Strigomonas culicis]|eukprot:EPY31222.1 MAP kinase kinase-like protein [Strigomonas culicis]
MHERQRIQLHADVEWAKVRDETESKISSMQNQLKLMTDQIAQINEKQKETQKKIMDLVERDHPELAWKSIISGSRILRLVKGSGLWLNVSFSDFQVVATLSSTVNSKVYHATRRGEHVALKEVPVDDEAARRRFHREVSIVASCTHPNVIRIMGVFFDGPFAYIILPFYAKGSVKSLLAAKTHLPWVSVQDMFRQATSGIAYLHERGIVHADIKPSNLLVTNEGQVVITDFGIARNNGTFGEQVDLTLTQTTSGAVCGTLQYMAPELLLPGPKETRHTATCMSDIWALGMTLCEWAMHNAAADNASLPAVQLPVLMPSEPCVHVDPKLLGGDPRLADMLSAALARDPARRPGAYTLLGYPYFTSLLHVAEWSSDLSQSDERLEAVRSYIHAVRQANDNKVLVSVSRGQMVESLAQIFASLDTDQVLRPIMVVFQGEAGIDEGALTSEMLNIFYEQLVRDKKALVSARSSVEESEEGVDTHGALMGATYLPAEDSSSVPVETFELLGKVLIKNIAESRPLPLQLNTAVLKYFCDVAPSILDLQEYDSAMAESLKRMRLMSSEDMEASGLDFSHFTEKFLNAQREGKYDVHSAVTVDNVSDYVELRVVYDLIEVRRNNLDAIKKGLYSIHSLSSHLKLLTPSDLLLLLCGAQHISVEVVVAALDCQGFSPSSHTPADLKSVLREMSQNNLRRFLQLCTSSATIPSSGTLKKIKVICCADTNRLPVGHGCVNQLDLPDYNNRNVLKEKLSVSLAHVSDGFHIV